MVRMIAFDLLDHVILELVCGALKPKWRGSVEKTIHACLGSFKNEPKY